MARDYAPKTWDGVVSQVARDVYKKVGNKIAKDMAHQFRSVIKAFYDDYHPRVYHRFRRAYYYANENGVKAYSKFVEMDKDGKGFSVRLAVSPFNIRSPYSSLVSGAADSFLQSLVFYNTWVLGQHGGKLPLRILSEEDQEKIQENPSIYWKPLKTTGWTWIPPVMERSPMELMDMWWKTYATNDNLDKLTRDVVTNSINRYIARANKRYGGIK